MSKVKRLNFTVSQFESVVPYASEHGQYVRYADYAKLEAEAQALREEVAALRARVVVVPEPLNEGDARRECGEYGVAMQRGYNACLRELARINGLTVSEGLLRRLCEPLLSHADYVVARNELRALFNEDKENGNG
ncbi:TPA: hypothetical protein NH769_001664 [Pseudomonas aeruginosa]|uniref:hypothetical protein n=1 Tax=Pseudomonas aeruginosa TaxID=287 RepID=UPI000FC43641|nr:hypothetical protein [Pseudomonas aeruginosa]MBI8762161.1 hypothetical protein [Pseudomonas aeruginosa]RUD01262.1 hypothetical protein IPC1377_26215 [Pseudomonas aeruginosa]HCF1060872.1 hypothetical protein [Pseudomonas aeruginosa]HEJ3740811.1 hypothetical protein [Pseudomonas aeruginosa]HEK0855050.1 hypothetical protein [Pseudomonas aeruginosa]